MPFFGLLIALLCFSHFSRRLRAHRHEHDHREAGSTGAHDEWWTRHACHNPRDHRAFRHAAKEARRAAKRAARGLHAAPNVEETSEEAALRRARGRAAAETGFYIHFLIYLAVIGFLALINLMTTHYPWFMWPALGWGVGVFSHYMGVYGAPHLRDRIFEPVVERELRRERAAMTTEKQASIDELSSTIAHEIRNPVAAAKSLVQQMGEDPTSVENVEYAKVALAELDRVERRISHLLKFAKEEDYDFALVSVATVVDAALTQVRSKLDVAKVAIARNYIGGPTVRADAEKLQSVFANILDNAVDAFASVPEARRIDLFVENGGNDATVRIRDNGCGIGADKIERIFNPFFTTKEKGTGLGMAIAKKVVEAHEGQISVVSEPGRGTEFRVSLPLPRNGS